MMEEMEYKAGSGEQASMRRHVLQSRPDERICTDMNVHNIHNTSYCRFNHISFPTLSSLPDMYNNAKLRHLTQHNVSLSGILTKLRNKFCVLPVVYAQSNDNDSEYSNKDNTEKGLRFGNNNHDDIQLKRNQSQIMQEDNSTFSKVVNWDNRTDKPKLRGVGGKLLVTEEEVDTYIARQSGFSRLYDLFFLRIENGMHHDLSTLIYQSMVGGMSAGIVYGLRGRDLAEERFKMSNKGRIFVNRFHASKSLRTAKGVGLAKMGLGSFFKYTGYLFVFMGLAVCIRNYNNKDRFTDYPLAGFVAGGLGRVYYGAAAGLVAGLLGATLSLLPAVIYYPLTQNPKYGMNQEAKHRAYIFKKIEDNKLNGLEGYGRR